MNGIGGASRTLAIVESSSGAASAASRKPVITSGVAGSIIIPPTISEISWSRSVKRVATPKLLSPPRSAQKRSGSDSSRHLDHLAIGGHQLNGEQVVDRQAVLAGQEADAAGQRDAAEPDRPGIAQPGHQACFAGGGRVLDPP